MSTRCGTPAGCRAHYRRGEKPCRPCREADNERMRRRSPAQGQSCRLCGRPGPYRLVSTTQGWQCEVPAACERRRGLRPPRWHGYGLSGTRRVTAPMDEGSHGTAAGARAHYRRGERPCAACRRAERLRRSA